MGMVKGTEIGSLSDDGEPAVFCPGSKVTVEKCTAAGSLKISVVVFLQCHVQSSCHRL